jgi:hypothetical protein
MNPLEVRNWLTPLDTGKMGGTEMIQQYKQTNKQQHDTKTTQFLKFPGEMEEN